MSRSVELGNKQIAPAMQTDSKLKAVFSCSASDITMQTKVSNLSNNPKDLRNNCIFNEDCLS